MKLGLQVDIDPRSGYCSGVNKAIRRAEELLEEGELYCLGQIVHNEEEVARLESKGMVTVLHRDIESVRNRTVLLRSHGEPPETYEILRRNGNRIIDATCPVVLKLQDRVRKSHHDGEQVLIYGKPEHPEVSGLLGQIGGDAIVFDDISKLDFGNLSPVLTLYSQTTMSLRGLHDAVKKLRHAGFEVTLRDTVCRQVSGRVEALREFCRKYDRILFVAGQHSSNGKVLFSECREANPNCHKVSSPGEIDPTWFSSGERVGICGATSTPPWLMEQVRDHLLRW